MQASPTSEHPLRVPTIGTLGQICPVALQQEACGVRGSENENPSQEQRGCH